jgi:hypothetical protein
VKTRLETETIGMHVFLLSVGFESVCLMKTRWKTDSTKHLICIFLLSVRFQADQPDEDQVSGWSG